MTTLETTKTVTARELRQHLFYVDHYCVFNGDDELDNSDSRRFLFDIKDQNEVFHYIDKGDHLLVWAAGYSDNPLDWKSPLQNAIKNRQ